MAAETVSDVSVCGSGGQVGGCGLTKSGALDTRPGSPS